MSSINRLYQCEQTAKAYEESIKKAIQGIKEADAVVVGAGSGMTASGGMSYMDPKLLEKWYPEFSELGFKGVMQVQSMFWHLNEKNVLEYWGYWARHINLVRFRLGILEPYQVLRNILNNRNYFIKTINADGQFQKVGFEPEKVTEPQGNFEYFQCIKPCCWDIVYPNEDRIKAMAASINEKHQISRELIPRCPNCGNFLIPNLRFDDKYVEEPHHRTSRNYETFIEANSEKKLLFLELGVGYTTPEIIRFPFENMTQSLENAQLIRINLGMAEIPEKISDKSISIDADITRVLSDLEKGLS